MSLKKLLILFIFILCLSALLFAAEDKTQDNTQPSEQQINDFSLAGYAEKGKKTWDISGKSADIFGEVVKLKDIVGNMYSEEEDVKLTAQQGDFDKASGKVHLEKDVVITTSKGARLTTDSLDWDRKSQVVTTKDKVKIERDNMVIVAVGARGEPSLKKVALNKKVKLDINPVKPDKDAKGIATTEKVTVTCDGALDVDYERNIATFNQNVQVIRLDSVIYSDKMDIYFTSAKVNTDSGKTGSMMGSKINKILASGNVKIVRGENISYSQEAVYNALENKIILNGRPKLVLYSAEDFNNASFGN
ncbi:MAG: LPS export ABC transporter periplasmic protein LptC [Candidatus Omnitrophica bacterium]|nr:LPS export ABC transporter periplasmic protein LptC [Candidatus Omnitrophota bacterium]